MLTTWQWVVGLIVSELIAVLLAYYFFLEPACCNEHTRDPQRRATRPQGLRLHIESGPGSDGGGFKLDMNHSGLQSPRILTLLTTYHNRTAYAKANIEAMEQRADGYKSLVSAKQRGHLLYVLVNAVCLLLSATWYEVFAVVGWDLRPLRLLLSAFSGKKLNEHVFFTYVRTYVRTYSMRIIYTRCISVAGKACCLHYCWCCRSDHHARWSRVVLLSSIILSAR